MLYVRMIFSMGVALYTSRVVLQSLGIEDFGIFQVAAGLITLLGFLQGAMTTSTQRYFAYDIGETNGKNLKSLFKASLTTHAILALVIIAIGETVGLWFFIEKITIPDGRVAAATTTYHFAILTFTASIILTPFNALLIAHERMGTYSLLGIMDVILKLAAAIAIEYTSKDRLSSYAAMMAAASAITLILSIATTKKLLPHASLTISRSKNDVKMMLGYTAWNLWGNLASALSNHGSTILLNIFFGPAINAGRSIATQANGALVNLSQNAQSAINPQIIKLYATGENSQMRTMLLNASRYNFLILLILSTPVLLYAPKLLEAWLTTPPPFAVIFLQLAILSSLVESFSPPLMTAAQATGNVKTYHAVIGGLLLLNLPLSYAALSLGAPPESVSIIATVVAVLALIARLLIISPLIDLPAMSFVRDTLTRSSFTLVLVAGTGLLCSQLAPFGAGNWFLNFITCGLLITITAIASGTNKKEKQFLVNFIKNKFQR